MNFHYTAHDDVPRDDAAVVDDGLGRANETAAPLHEVQALACFARRDGGEVVGGAIGRTWGTCCELQQLWVDPVHRRQGIGAGLVRRFEQRAASRGCTSFFLETFSFQAPAFYESLGYRAATEFRGFPHDIVKYVMARHSAPTDGPPGVVDGTRSGGPQR